MKTCIKKLLFAAAFMMPAMTALADGDLLAFPGAEGFGRYTTGGRGGKIVHVTNLNDSGSGSLREAVSSSGTAIIVFDVSGVIELQSALVFTGNKTILGQTAPGEGVQVYGDRVSFSNASNLIVRHMRFRMGIGGTSGADACGIANGTDMIFDHLSVLWGRDENFSVNWDDKNSRPANITIQNSIIGQGLQSHSCGGLIQTIGGVTLYRNLYIENKTRNPKVKGLNQYVNNVVYNWGDGACYIMSDSEGDSFADIQNNYFMKGPWENSTEPFTRGISSFRYYGAGNYYDDDKDGVLNGHLMTEDEMRGSSGGTAPFSTYFSSLDALNEEIAAYNKTNSDDPVQQISPISNIMTAADAYAWMIDSVGSVLPARDEVDQYLIDELVSYGTDGTTGGISTEKTLPHKGTGTLSGGVKPLDSDGDGIPDEWESANGLDPNDASDAAAIDPETGYAYIELYSFSITEAYPYIKKPVNLTVTSQEKTGLGLSWELNGNTGCGFIIELSDDGGVTYAEAARIEAGVTSCTLSDLTPETEYMVRMCAYSDDGLYSDYTDAVSTETIGDPSVPEQSTDPFPSDGGKEGVAGGLTLSWENATKNYYGTVSYEVFLGTDPENLTSIASGLTDKELAMTDPEAGLTYYWRVDATNDVGTTTGTVWSFSTISGGVLFYSDFYKQPQEYFDKYGEIGDNTNIIYAANTTVTIGGMTFGTGENKNRIIAMSGSNNSSSSSSDYGPDTADDEGASNRCVQFYTTASGSYLTTPEVTGPCIVTLYIANPETKAKEVKLNTIVNGVEQTVQTLSLPARKRMFKFTYTYLDSDSVQFKIDNNAAKFNINDFLIERYIPSDGSEPIELVSGTLVNDDLSYADGSLSLTFNQEIAYKGTAEIQGTTQWETFGVSASGKKLTISYEALNVNSEYAIAFPEGAITDLTGKQSYTDTVRLNTCDFPREKESGDTHYGKAAAELPLDFVPFLTVAPFVTEGGLVQTQLNDYPHWVQASGTKSDDAVQLTSTSDKVMAYFAPQSKLLYLDLEYSGSGTVNLKIQESRNCDIPPGWRTVRVLDADDFPFTGTLPLNSETHFVKVSATTLSSGYVTVKGYRISDDAGSFGDDIDGIGTVLSDAGDLRVGSVGSEIVISGVAAGIPVSVYDIAGRQVASCVAEQPSATVTLPSGIYFVRAGTVTVKIRH